MNVIVYLKTNCPWARAVTDLLNERGIAFEERDVTTNSEFAREVEEKSGQCKSPTLDIDGKILPDAGVENVEEYLESIGSRA